MALVLKLYPAVKLEHILKRQIFKRYILPYNQKPFFLEMSRLFPNDFTESYEIICSQTMYFTYGCLTYLLAMLEDSKRNV